MRKVLDNLSTLRYNAYTVNNKERIMALQLQDLLDTLDDIKSELYELVDDGQLNENINDQVQELLREVYGMLEEEVDNAS